MGDESQVTQVKILKQGEILVLGSASPRRRQLLEQAGIEFRVSPARNEEKSWGGEEPRAFVEGQARDKALSVMADNPGCLVLAADTIVAMDGQVFGKPRNLSEAREMLRNFSGREHQVYTGVCLGRDGRVLKLSSEESVVLFKRLAEEDIENYMSLVYVLDKAGAYAVQEHGELMISEVRGSTTNVVGLPMELVGAMLSGD